MKIELEQKANVRRWLSAHNPTKAELYDAEDACRFAAKRVLSAWTRHAPGRDEKCAAIPYGDIKSETPVCASAAINKSVAWVRPTLFATIAVEATLGADARELVSLTRWNDTLARDKHEVAATLTRAAEILNWLFRN